MEHVVSILSSHSILGALHLKEAECVMYLARMTGMGRVCLI